MIQSTKTNVPKSSEISYPCLMKSNISGNVWLLQSYGKGIKVYFADGITPLGARHDSLNMSVLAPFVGTIELSNPQ